METPGHASIVELLEFIDPHALPREVRETIKAIGPELVRGETFTQIAHSRGYERDWASHRIAVVRAAFLTQAADHLDEMSAPLRARVTAELEALPPAAASRARVRSPRRRARA